MVHETYWYVLVTGIDLAGDESTLVDLCTTNEAAARASYERAASNYLDVHLERWAPVFFARCVVCGEGCGSGSLLLPFRGWEDLVDDVRYYAGWTTTSEQQVFCPNHRPDKEN
ncbi:hypothetical protein AB0878_48940 [Amycolatopsis sp. NPDC047767]|uniref:hypothetical protein n=1 Tax=Amycolatopsis sp. NPDC047767 TaxID=3156765 RepID=UPI00345696A1